MGVLQLQCAALKGLRGKIYAHGDDAMFDAIVVPAIVMSAGRIHLVHPADEFSDVRISCDVLDNSEKRGIARQKAQHGGSQMVDHA